MARVRGIEGNVVVPLSSGWQCASCAPGALDGPDALRDAPGPWFDARVPGTAASSLAAASAWSLKESRDFDAEDWWYRARVPASAVPGGHRVVLRFGGLATLADVWVDGVHRLRSENMFVEHELDVTGQLHKDSEIVLRFASLGAELKKRRPRPRWRSRVVAQQQLRWFRTTLLGRIPGWTPPAAPVGPHGSIDVETQARLCVLSADVRPRLEGRDGVCDASLRLTALEGAVDGVRLRVGTEESELACERGQDGVVIARGSIRLREVSPWWPAPYGDPSLYSVGARVRMTGGDVLVDLGRTGFRAIDLRLEDGGFGLAVNGAEIFCRGAVWTPTDVVSVQDTTAQLAASLGAVKAAGMNMLRVSGTMLYPGPELIDACDELGILLWHDFMFATMDYPTADESFMASVRAEAIQATSRLQLSPSLAVLCGNTEGQQQVAMLGLDPKEARSSLFDDVLPSIAAVALPGVPYVSSTPTGGTLPFHVDTGVSHYYGVGAYLRPLEDARRSRVRFTSECLGFANVPSDDLIDELMDGGVPTQHPLWKARVPRDSGTAWDFDDVRDHYLRELFGVDPGMLRTTDVRRYLELSRLASGEAMAGAMSEWRRAGSECRGALVWFLRDLWPGAGWGLLDARGRPKAAYYILRRVLQPVAVLALDEGLNGLALHILNDTPRPLDAELRLDLYRHGEIRVGEGVMAVEVPPRGSVCISGDALLARFADTTYAYRFGPPGLDLALATLHDVASGRLLSRAFHFPAGRPVEPRSDLGLEAAAVPGKDGDWTVTVRSRRLAYAVALDVPGFVAGDDFFHVPPGGETAVSLRSVQPSARPSSARVLPVNAVAPCKVVWLDHPDPKRVDLHEDSHG